METHAKGLATAERRWQAVARPRARPLGVVPVRLHDQVEDRDKRIGEGAEVPDRQLVPVVLGAVQESAGRRARLAYNCSSGYPEDCSCNAVTPHLCRKCMPKMANST